MTGIIDRIQSAIGSDYAKIADLAHQTFQTRMTHHGHFGRAFVETVAEVCRHHPAVIGLGAGLLVDRLLVEEARHHDAKVKAEAAAGAAPSLAIEAQPASKPAKAAKGKAHEPIRLTTMKPGRVAVEVFGGLLLLKMAATGAKIFRHKHQTEVWFAPAAKIHLFSGTLAAYNLTKALRSKNVSAWRNGAILFFGTDAIKPVIKWYKKHPPLAHKAPEAVQPAVDSQTVVTPPYLVASTPEAAPAAQSANLRQGGPQDAAEMAKAYGAMFSTGVQPEAQTIRLETAPDPALTAAQAFYGMMRPKNSPNGAGGPNLQIIN